MESANPDLKHPQAAFAEPLPYGYVYVGMTVDPPGRAPFVRLRCPAPSCPWNSTNFALTAFSEVRIRDAA